MTSSAKAAQIILVNMVFIICKDELRLTKKWAEKVLQGSCLYSHKPGKCWILRGAYLFCQEAKEEKMFPSEQKAENKTVGISLQAF